MIHPRPVPILILLSIAVLNASTLLAQPPSLLEETPFELNSNKIYLNITINGVPNQPAAMDTGAPPCCLDTDLARRLGLATHSAGRTGGAGEKRVESAAAENVVFTIGNLNLPPLGVMVLPLDATLCRFEGRHLRALIGGTIISRYIVEIDYAASKLGFHDPKRFTYTGPGHTIPMRINGWPFIHATITFPGRPPIDADFALDTGARTPVSLSTELVNRHHLLDPPPEAAPDGQPDSLEPALKPRFKPVLRTVGCGLGGELRHYIARLESLSIGGAVLTGPVATLSQDKAGVFADPELAGIIGAEVLKRYRVYLDYQGGRLILEARTDAGLPDAINMDCSGLFLVAEGEDLKTITVLSVGAGSPGAEAGVREGDVIRAIGDEPVGDLDGARRALKEPGRVVPITIERGGEEITIRLVTRALV